MATARVIIKQTGMQDARIMLKEVGDRAVDFTPPLKEGGIMMLRSIQTNFNVSGRPKWRPLSSNTMISKLRRGITLKPLIGEIGTLRSSVTYSVQNRNKLIIGSNTPYSRIHQLGGTTHPRVTKRMRGWAWHMYYETNEDIFKGIALTKKSRLEIKIPARPYLVFQKEDLEKIADLAASHIANGGSNA